MHRRASEQVASGAPSRHRQRGCVPKGIHGQIRRRTSVRARLFITEGRLAKVCWPSCRYHLHPTRPAVASVVHQPRLLPQPHRITLAAIAPNAAPPTCASSPSARSWPSLPRSPALQTRSCRSSRTLHRWTHIAQRSADGMRDWLRRLRPSLMRMRQAKRGSCFRASWEI